MKTNTIQYTCECGRAWMQTYYVEIEEESRMVHLSRIVARETPPDDGLCPCGKRAEAILSTPMPGYTKIVVRHLTPARQTQSEASEEFEQRSEEMIQHLITQETAFLSWERMDALEEMAAKIVELGYTPASWQLLPAEYQAKLLGVDCTVVPRHPDSCGGDRP